MRNMCTVHALTACLYLALMPSCGNTEAVVEAPPTAPQAQSGSVFKVRLGMNLEVQGMVMPDGQVIPYESEEQFVEAGRQWIIAHPETISNDDLVIEFDGATNPASTSETGEAQQPVYIKGPANIGIRIGFEKHFVGGPRPGCIRANRWHAQLLLNYHSGPKKGQMISNIHVAIWGKGKFPIPSILRPCLAIYESKRPRCWGPWCGMTILTKTVGKLADAIEPEVDSRAVAMALAAAATGILLGTATVVPGVPPPP